MTRDRSPIRLRCGPPAVHRIGPRAGQVWFDDLLKRFHRRCAWECDRDLGAAEFAETGRMKGWRRVLHRSTRPECREEWQVSTFDPDGQAWGHQCAPTCEAALADSIGYTMHGHKLVRWARRK